VGANKLVDMIGDGKSEMGFAGAGRDGQMKL
jgi:hypothetical protein